MRRLQGCEAWGVGFVAEVYNLRLGVRRRGWLPRAEVGNLRHKGLTSA
jgi:hypothetical protein